MKVTKRHSVVIQLLYVPIGLLQFFLVVLGWQKFIALSNEFFGWPSKTGNWVGIGPLLALLFLAYPAYLMLASMRPNKEP